MDHPVRRAPRTGSTRRAGRHTIVTLRKRLAVTVWSTPSCAPAAPPDPHLASSGFPIVGDDKYGTDETRAAFARRGFGHMFLHAPADAASPLTGETLRLTADLPPACFIKLLKQLETA